MDPQSFRFQTLRRQGGEKEKEGGGNERVGRYEKKKGRVRLRIGRGGPEVAVDCTVLQSQEQEKIDMSYSMAPQKK